MSHELKLPLWQCHKQVRASQIVDIRDNADGQRLTLHSGVTVEVDAVWAQRHDAKVGGYYVAYEDGYASYSPREAFEGGYTLIPQGA